jgi:serine/threonine protein kinase
MTTREGAVKLIDFGIATRSGTRDSSLTGKPAYMAPEMIVELRADNRSDIFSLGTVLYEMLTGERLFTGQTTAEVLEQVISAHLPSPRARNPDIPDAVLVILKTALQRDPAKRFVDAAQMGAACEHFLYDKGYGPTNLALKQYLTQLFPLESAPTPFRAVDESGFFPVIDPTLIPISDPAAGFDSLELDEEPDQTLPPDASTRPPSSETVVSSPRRMKPRKKQ